MPGDLQEFGRRERAAAPWVLLPGWGFGGAVLEPLAQRLARQHHVFTVDLPGWGATPALDEGAGVAELADAVLARVPRPARWVGWSLGGLVALAAAARETGAVTGLDLLAATPRFARGAGWPGIESEQLEQFTAAVAEDPAAAHRRFLGFQLAGSEGAHRALRTLRACSRRQPLAPAHVLRDGLAILRDADLREALAALSCPVRALLGGQDPLVPAAVGAKLAAMGVDVRVIDGAGHAPFLSHPGAVDKVLTE